MGIHAVSEIPQLLSDGISLTAPVSAQTPQEQGQDKEHLSPAIALKQHCSGVTCDSTFQATKNRYMRIIICFYFSKPFFFKRQQP